MKQFVLTHRSYLFYGHREYICITIRVKSMANLLQNSWFGNKLAINLKKTNWRLVTRSMIWWDVVACECITVQAIYPVSDKIVFRAYNFSEIRWGLSFSGNELNSARMFDCNLLFLEFNLGVNRRVYIISI